jgi:hypothetical protein
MATASYNGLFLFGRSVRTKRTGDPAATQETAYPGLDGVESTPLGKRGKFIVLTSVLYSQVSSADLNAQMRTIESFDDGIARPFVDTFGQTHDWAILQTPDFGDKVYLDGYWGWCVVLTVRFRLLT